MGGATSVAPSSFFQHHDLPGKMTSTEIYKKAIYKLVSGCEIFQPRVYLKALEQNAKFRSQAVSLKIFSVKILIFPECTIYFKRYCSL